MNRREFTKSLAAASVTAALPVPKLAKAAPVAAMAKDSMFFWANFVTRVHNKCSPGMLTRLLKLDPDHSERLFAELLADGAVTAPDAYGLSRSTDPLFPKFSQVTGHGPSVKDMLDESKVQSKTSQAAPQDSQKTSGDMDAKDGLEDKSHVKDNQEDGTGEHAMDDAEPRIESEHSDVTAEPATPADDEAPETQQAASFDEADFTAS